MDRLRSDCVCMYIDGCARGVGTLEGWVEVAVDFGKHGIGSGCRLGDVWNTYVHKYVKIYSCAER